MPRVLIVEDDESMAVALKDGFAYEGYSVTLAKDGAAGMRMACEGNHDLVVLDVMLPKVSGLDILRRVRGDGGKVPVIMLTARGQEIDKVLGLKLGADDYVTKPFSFMELMARVEAVLRRTSGQAGTLDSYQFGDLKVNFRTFEATRNGEAISLTAREFKILMYLVEHRGEVLPREKLLGAVWGYDSIPVTRTVDMHIAKLRKKIESTPADPRYIVTVHGVGYKFTG